MGFGGLNRWLEVQRSENGESSQQLCLFLARLEPNRDIRTLLSYLILERDDFERHLLAVPPQQAAVPLQELPDWLTLVASGRSRVLCFYLPMEDILALL